MKFTFYIGEPPLPIKVEEVGSFLNIHPKGYGQPVSLDWHEGKLRVLINADPNEEEPQIIELTREEE